MSNKYAQFTAAEIEKAKTDCSYAAWSDTLTMDAHHEHDDCIRIAAHWLDAQRKTKHPNKRACTDKHMIERWDGRYVSVSDVCVAAELLGLSGSYPGYNLSAITTEPAFDRLKTIGEALTQSYSPEHDDYRHEEV